MDGTLVGHELGMDISEAAGKLDSLGARVHGHDVRVGASVLAREANLNQPRKRSIQSESTNEMNDVCAGSIVVSSGENKQKKEQLANSPACATR